MKKLWSMRLRASRQDTKSGERHISGAEGLYGTPDIRSTIRQYIERALTHPKGEADKIVITIEEIKLRPKVIKALPVATINCRTGSAAKTAVIEILKSSGVSERAIENALKMIKESGMRGASVIKGRSGARLEPDKEKGVRVSRLGISNAASRILSSKLSRHRINTDTVKEALILASKVASCRNVVAELCVSDDPDYTTGYVASGRFGYIRIPHIKNKGSINGGRAFFINGSIDIKEIINYLERVPVIIGKVSGCRGIVQLDEILNRSHH